MEHIVKIDGNRIYIGVSAADCYAELDFTVENDRKLIAYHTYVEPTYRGKHLAFEMFKKLIDIAETNNYKIIGHCDYVNAMLNLEQYQHYRYLPNE